MPSPKELSIIGILVASLLGSAHCAVMCGGFVSIIQSRASLKGLMLYHTGRLFTYASLGAAAGLLGKKLNALSGVSELAVGLICAWFLFQAVAVFLPAAPAKIGATPRISGFLAKIAPRLFDRPLLFGLIAGFLPCGWLYSNILLAATVADPIQSAFLMTAFWLGTIPALQSVAYFCKFIKNILPTKGRLAISVFYVLFALLSVYFHFLNTSKDASHSCHEAN